MKYQILYRFYHENSVGEQTNGPELKGPVYADRGDAETEADRLRTRHAGRNGASSWTTARVVVIPDGGQVDPVALADDVPVTIDRTTLDLIREVATVLQGEPTIRELLGEAVELLAKKYGREFEPECDPHES